MFMIFVPYFSFEWILITSYVINFNPLFPWLYYSRAHELGLTIDWSLNFGVFKEFSKYMIARHFVGHFVELLVFEFISSYLSYL